MRSTTKQSGVEALELYKSRPAAFDGVITDLRMPTMSGQTFIQEIRRFEREHVGGRRKVPVVVMTAESAPEERRLCLTQYGADEFLLKPVKLRDLVMALARIHTTSPAGHSTSATKPKRILIVDDDTVGSKFMLITLTRAGHHCVQAFSLYEARQKLEEQTRYDIVILDSFLGDGTGPEFVRLAQQRLEGVKVISVSGNAVEDQRRMYETETKNEKHGLDGYLQKPVNRQDLFGMIQLL